MLLLTARDIQAWEYVPLGPFLGKNFGKKSFPLLMVNLTVNNRFILSRNSPSAIYSLIITFIF